jgi:hypothetical protein
LIKQHIFRAETDLFKKTAVKWKSIANRDNGTRFAIEEDSEGNIWFGDRDTGPGNMMAKV